MTWNYWIPVLVYAGLIAAFTFLLLAARTRIRVVAGSVALGALFVMWLIGERTLFWTVPAAVALTVVLAALILRLRTAWARGLAVLGVSAALIGVWTLGNALERRGWHNVGGYVDCWPSCTRWHLLGSTLTYGPAIVGLALALVVGLQELRESELRNRSQVFRVP